MVLGPGRKEEEIGPQKMCSYLTKLMARTLTSSREDAAEEVCELRGLSRKVNLKCFKRKESKTKANNNEGAVKWVKRGKCEPVRGPLSTVRQRDCLSGWSQLKFRLSLARVPLPGFTRYSISRQFQMQTLIKPCRRKTVRQWVALAVAVLKLKFN